MNNKMHELLAPSGNYEKALFALNFGADAIYIAAKAYSLRARASNFEIEEIKRIVDYAHKINKKVYIVLNIFCHNVHLKNFPIFFKKIMECNLDGAICADPFIIKKIRELDPTMEIHISTQQSITNSKAALFWKRNKASRVVLAREVDYDNLKNITDKLEGIIELEYFIHGAVCIAFSGRCTMSNNFSFRDANIGGCAHSCRWEYEIKNCPSVTHLFTMSAKDMNLSTEINKLLELKIHSFKIEGRMKSLHYIATVVSNYKKLFDNYFITKNLDKKNIEEIKKSENRVADIACFDNNPNYEKMLYFEDDKTVKQSFAFIVKEHIHDNQYLVILKNKIKLNDTLESISYKNDSFTFKIIEIMEDNILLEDASKPMFEYLIRIDGNLKLASMDLARKVRI